MHAAPLRAVPYFCSAAMQVVDSARTTAQTAAGAFVGSMAYAAPEYLCGELSAYSVECDVYSFGVFLWELVSCERPWADVPPMRLPATVSIRRERPVIPDGVPPALAALIAASWHHDPAARPTFASLADELSAQQSGL